RGGWRDTVWLPQGGAGGGGGRGLPRRPCQPRAHAGSARRRRRAAPAVGRGRPRRARHTPQLERYGRPLRGGALGPPPRAGRLVSARVSVVVANYNGEALLPDLLDSLAAQSVPPEEVIVVDNASTDFSRELVRERGGCVRLLELERNLGAAQARSVGSAAASGDVFAFVDNDSIAHTDWTREALAALERHPGWGAVGSLVYYHAN